MDCATGVVVAEVQRTQGAVVGKGIDVTVGASFIDDDHVNEICDPQTKRCGAKDNNRVALSSTSAVAALHHNLV